MCITQLQSRECNKEEEEEWILGVKISRFGYIVQVFRSRGLRIEELGVWKLPSRVWCTVLAFKSLGGRVYVSGGSGGEGVGVPVA